MLVYLDITNKTYLENANLFWKYASAKYLIWDKKEQLWHWQAVWGQNHIHWTICVVEIASRNSK